MAVTIDNSPDTVAPATTGLRKIAVRSIAWLQAGPMMLVFTLFFLLPLVLVVIVSVWDYNEYEMIPAFSFRGYTDTFEGCVANPSCARS